MNDVTYLDNNATTALDERVFASMLPALRHAGNASSTHAAGQWAREAVETARGQVADLLAANRQEIIFTSGATEANNLAINGIVGAGGRTEIVSCTTEHAAVLEPLEQLRRSGRRVTLVPVDVDGMIDLAALAAAVTERTLLISVMAANNETGVLTPLSDVAGLAQAKGALVHTDATQLIAWGGVDTSVVPVDLLSLSAHKFHGPTGVGALYVRRAVQQQMLPIVHGGGHERGLRSGTLNTAGIVGLGAAAEISRMEGFSAGEATRDRRDRLYALLRNEFGPLELQLNGHATLRAPGTLNISLLGLEADAVLAAAPSVAMSTGSACSTGVPGPSHVLTAMGFGRDRAEGAIRISLSRDTSEADILVAGKALIAGIRQVQTQTALVGAR